MALERALIWLSGENYDKLRPYPGDEFPYLLIGMAIVVSAPLAGFAAVALLQLLSSTSLPVQIPVAFIAAVVSVSLDRFLVTALLTRHAGRGAYVTALLFRGLLGVVAAICVASLVIMHFATLDFHRQLVAAQQQNAQAYFAALDESKLVKDISSERHFIAAIAKPDPKVQNLQALLRSVQVVAEIYDGNYICLSSGRCGTAVGTAAGQKQAYENAVAQASKISSMISSLEDKDAAVAAQAKAELPTVESQLKSNIAAENKLTTSFLRSNRDPGLLGRLSAVYQASNRGWVRVARWVLLALLFIVVFTPVWVKFRLTGKDTPYQRSLESGREELAGYRTTAVRQSTPDGYPEERMALEEIYGLLEDWNMRIPASRKEVADIGSRITRALLRDWETRRRGR